MHIVINILMIFGLLGILYLESIYVDVMWDKIDRWSEERKRVGRNLIARKFKRH